MVYDDKNFIGKTIRTLRKRAGLKQSELAEKIGISEKHLSKIETGKNLPSLENFFKMAEVLNYNLKDFGLNIKNFEDKNRQKLLKIAYSATDYEVKSYLSLIEVLSSIIKRQD